jgi:hypothetical protein
MTIEYFERALREQDATIERLQARVERLERAHLDVIAFLEWKAKQKKKR